MLTSPPRRLLKTRSAVETEAAKLRHKLSQAIEGARQREGLKKSLDDVKASRDSLAAQNAKLRKEAKEREAGRFERAPIGELAPHGGLFMAGQLHKSSFSTPGAS